jgi:DNA-directed DNA polymerase III PolC
MASTHFSALRAHSWYSLAEGVDSPETLLARATELGYRALALTDTNCFYGAIPFLEASRRFPDLKPLLGCRLEVKGRGCTVLIREPVGYRTLCRALSTLHLVRPPSVLKILQEHHEGLVALTDDPDAVPALFDVFGPHLWLEVVRHGRPQAEERALLEAGVPLGLKPVASLAPYFATAAGHDAYRWLAALRGKTTLDKVSTPLVTAEHHLADPDAVLALYDDMPEAVTNTEAVAASCRRDVLPVEWVEPPAKVEEGQDAPGYLRLLCERALTRLEWADAEQARRRLEEELRLICQRGLASYFLVCWDIAREARQQGWPMTIRGSAGSSLVCFLLGVSDIDPLRYGLQLDRFLHPGRVDRPDIDLDFDARVLPKVWEWVVGRYGAEQVARVGQLQRLGPPGAFVAAAKAVGLRWPQIQEVRGALGDRLEALGADPDEAEGPPHCWPLEPERWDDLVAGTRLLTGRPDRWVLHNSGLFMTPGPVRDYAPLERYKGKVVAQLDKCGVEAVGLDKIDLLSSHALSALSEGCALVKALGGDPRPPRGDADAATLGALSRAETLGLSHLETPAMRRLLAQVQPRCLTDLIQALALVRPGASGGKNVYLRRRRGAEPPRPLHPALGGLAEQYHVLLYQDDVAAVIRDLTGCSPAAADRLRQQFADPQEADQASEAFGALCEAAEVAAEVARQVCALLRRFNAYSLCKSHAVSYGRLAWQEAWLRAHHPLPSWVASLNHCHGVYPVRVYVEALKRLGVPVFLPDLNSAGVAFTHAVCGIRAGLTAVRGIDRKVAAAAVEDRRRRGPFLGLADVSRRVPELYEHRARLILAGAFDFTGKGRQALLAEAGVGTGPGLRLWAPDRDDREPWPCPEASCHRYPLAGQWRGEWEALGFLAAGAPLMQVVRAGLGPAYQSLPDSRAVPALAGKRVRVAGLAATARRHPALSGEQLQFVTLEDEWGLIEAVVTTEEACVGIGPWVADGMVEEQFGVAVLKVGRLARALPGVPPEAADEAQSAG